MNTPHTQAPTGLNDPHTLNPHVVGQTELPIADIHLPHHVSAWPPAMGWWLLTVVFIATCAACIAIYKKHRKKWGYRHAALRLLAQEYTALGHADPHITATALLSILKRTAISAYPAQDLQGIYGEAWVACLNRQTPKAVFTHEMTAYLVAQQYQATATTNAPPLHLDALYQACQQWIKRHHTQFQAEVS